MFICFGLFVFSLKKNYRMASLKNLQLTVPSLLTAGPFLVGKVTDWFSARLAAGDGPSRRDGEWV